MESFLSGRTNLAGNSSTGAAPQKASSNFQPLVVRGANIPANQPASEQPSEAAHCDSTAEPQLELIQGKSGIERIVVICGCGKRIEIQCEYA